MMQTLYWHGIDLKWAYSDVLRNIYRHTYCKQIALDILHDSLIRYALAKNPDRQQYPQAFLQTIIRNQLIDSHNHSAKFVSLDAEDTGDTNTFDLHKHAAEHQLFAPSAEHLLDIQQRLQAMQVLIDNLPTRCREAFWLFRIEGKDQSEIAVHLGISRNMVQRHVMRAMMEILEAQDLLK
jgi:RNA polymerase sigma factor (sigma-70 family)